MWDEFMGAHLVHFCFPSPSRYALIPELCLRAVIVHPLEDDPPLDDVIVEDQSSRIASLQTRRWRRLDK